VREPALLSKRLSRDAPLRAGGTTLKDDELLHKVVRDELGNRGYVVTIQARRDGDLVIGRLQVTSAETNETVAKLVGAGKMENLNVCFGLDAEGTLRDMFLRALSTWQGVQNVVPAVILKAGKP